MIRRGRARRRGRCRRCRGVIRRFEHRVPAGEPLNEGAEGGGGGGHPHGVRDVHHLDRGLLGRLGPLEALGVDAQSLHRQELLRMKGRRFLWCRAVVFGEEGMRFLGRDDGGRIKKCYQSRAWLLCIQ
ncbi:unnamed protein product [Musa acuminata subsp. burmannicoides]